MSWTVLPCIRPPQDLRLASGEPREPGHRHLMFRALLVPRAQELLSLLVGHDRLPLVDPPDRRQDAAERLALRQHGSRAAPDGLTPASAVGRGGHHDHVDTDPGQRCNQTYAVAEATQVEVEEHDARPQPHQTGQQACRGSSRCRERRCGGRRSPRPTRRAPTTPRRACGPRRSGCAAAPERCAVARPTWSWSCPTPRTGALRRRCTRSIIRTRNIPCGHVLGPPSTIHLAQALASPRSRKSNPGTVVPGLNLVPRRRIPHQVDPLPDIDDRRRVAHPRTSSAWWRSPILGAPSSQDVRTCLDHSRCSSGGAGSGAGRRQGTHGWVSAGADGRSSSLRSWPWLLRRWRQLLPTVASRPP